MQGLNIDRTVFLFAASVIIASVVAAIVTELQWPLYITLFVGANMLQAAITTFCPLAWILKWLGIPIGAAFFGSKLTTKDEIQKPTELQTA
jgi:hypothetical protein